MSLIAVTAVVRTVSTNEHQWISISLAPPHVSEKERVIMLRFIPFRRICRDGRVVQHETGVRDEHAGHPVEGQAEHDLPSNGGPSMQQI